MVLLDELDKLPGVDPLTEVVNAIKDLFHVPGVHFLVSVSDEALASFALRGLQPRDAFDSTFDTIVQMSRLTPDEAVTMLESRAVGLPKTVSLFCGVWAGGLPRDLIRAARGCVEVAAGQVTPQPWQTIVRAFLRDEIERRVNSAGLNESEDTELRGVLLRCLDNEDSQEAWAVVHKALESSRDSSDQAKSILALTGCSLRALHILDSLAPGKDSPHELEDLATAVAGLDKGRPGASRAIRALLRPPDTI